MKTKLIHLLVVLALLAGVFQASAQGTAFTYSGKLNNGSNPANGSYDLKFSLFTLTSGGSALAGPLTNSATGVTNGLFTVTLDFGNVFDGANRWLEIGVRTNGPGAFTTLAPRQQLTPTPYAIFANTASNLSGVLPAGQLNGKVSLAQLPSAVVTNNNTTALNLTGTFAGNGAGLTNLNVTLPGGLTSSNLWQLGGNNVPAGKFLGSTNNQPVEIRVNNQRVVQLAYASNSASGYSPNVVLGHSVNFVSNTVVGGTIGGGGSTNGRATFNGNRVLADFGTIVGGDGNIAGGIGSVAGGYQSWAFGYCSTALGLATASGDGSTALGGSGASGNASTAMGNSAASGDDSTAMGSSVASALFATAMGISTASGTNSTAMGASTASGFASTAMGNQNAAQGDYSTTPGGNFNWAPGKYSFAAGNRAKAIYDGDFAWADSQPTDFNSTANDQFCIRAQGGVQLDNSTSMFCGTQTRQMLNLWNTNYAIGVQSNTEYFRSSWVFAWFRGGGHSDDQKDPGAGGVLNLYLDQNGNLGVTGYVNATAYNTISDRNLKAGFEPVDTKTVLEKVASMSISRWHFTNDVTTTHLGPMAQDFYAAFNVGMDDKHIATVDEEGVALAAIQGLNQKLNEKDAEIQNLKQQNDSLAKRLDVLELTLKSIAQSK